MLQLPPPFFSGLHLLLRHQLSFQCWPFFGVFSELLWMQKASARALAFDLCGETEIRTRGPINRSQLSRLLHYHSATSPKNSAATIAIKRSREGKNSEILTCATAHAEVVCILHTRVA